MECGVEASLVIDLLLLTAVYNDLQLTLNYHREQLQAETATTSRYCSMSRPENIVTTHNSNTLVKNSRLPTIKNSLPVTALLRYPLSCSRRLWWSRRMLCNVEREAWSGGDTVQCMRASSLNVTMTTNVATP